uniref:Protein kinase domain-containing protein n=1 Tax=Steinernema glaseri TaxID=37863 RepID=A0A1I7YI06_9BILA
MDTSQSERMGQVVVTVLQEHPVVGMFCLPGLGMNHQKAKEKGQRSGCPARSVPPLLKDGQVIGGRYQVDFMISGGGFGQIFKVTDSVERVDLAIKVEPPEKDIEIEFIILSSLRGCVSRYPKDEGVSSTLEPYSRSSGERNDPGMFLYHHDAAGEEPERTAEGGRAEEVLSSDCLPNRAAGMARQISDKYGNIRRTRDHAGFRGTMRYASLQMHQKKEVGPGDDFIGLLYTMIELSEGTLPWATAKTAEQVQKIKETLGTPQLCQNQPKDMLTFANYAYELHWDVMPNYYKIEKLFFRCMGEGITGRTPYDWQKKKFKESEEQEVKGSKGE